MDVIPVIDVKHGEAVRARRGDRARYQPIKTPLADGSDPVAVALGLRALFAFPTLYVADLDGIEGRGRNADLAGRLKAVLPDTELWIDEGASAQTVAGDLERDLPFTPVVGTESLQDADGVAALRALAPERYVLSLDFKGEEFNGPVEVLDEVQRWPERVIVMTLAKVGSDEGPDLQRIASVVAKAGTRSVYAAGGVRNADDIAALMRAGAAGVLIASALHDKKITAGDLNKIAGR